MANDPIALNYAVDYDGSQVYLSGTGWTNPAYRNIKITKDTSVSPAFYNWFMANAIEVVPISGTWVFNATPAACPGNFDVNFTSNGSSFIGIYYSVEAAKSDPIFYMRSATSALQYVKVYDNKVWENQAYRTITFEGTQHVSKTFYDWFVANAVKQ